MRVWCECSHITCPWFTDLCLGDYFLALKEMVTRIIHFLIKSIDKKHICCSLVIVLVMCLERTCRRELKMLESIEETETPSYLHFMMGKTSKSLGALASMTNIKWRMKNSWLSEALTQRSKDEQQSLFATDSLEVTRLTVTHLITLSCVGIASAKS